LIQGTGGENVSLAGERLSQRQQDFHHGAVVEHGVLLRV